MYRILDLFCGIGGFSYGFEMTKQYKTVLGVDMWDVALNTFKLNHMSTDIKLSDIKELKLEFWKQYKNKIDVIIAGPPCQGFSMSGKRDILDNRNNLFREVIRVVNIIKPRVVVIENVVGLISMSTSEGILVKDIIIQELQQLHYKVDMKILNAAEYGVPQYRRRVIFIATKTQEPIFPKPTHGEGLLPIITVGDAVSNIPNNTKIYDPIQNSYQELMSGKKEIDNHEPINHAELIVKRMSTIPQGGNWQDIPLELGQGGGLHSNNYRRLKNNEPSITIKHVSKSMIIHPLYHRTPTVREVARLQSFNDNFILTGTKYDQHQQLANAVPPLLGKAIAEALLPILDGNKC